MIRRMGWTAAAAILLSCAGVTDLCAANGWINQIASSALTTLIRDEIRGRIYLLDHGNNRVVVIDSDAPAVRATVAMPTGMVDMAMSKDARWLAVVGGRIVMRIELNTLRLQRFILPAEVTDNAISVAFGYGECLFVVTTAPEGARPWGWIYYLEPTGDRLISRRRFGVGTSLGAQVYSGLVKTDATGTILYVGERGISPMVIHKLNVSTPWVPVFVARSIHGALGSNLQDLRSPRATMSCTSLPGPHTGFRWSM